MKVKAKVKEWNIPKQQLGGATTDTFIRIIHNIDMHKEANCFGHPRFWAGKERWHRNSLSLIDYHTDRNLVVIIDSDLSVKPLIKKKLSSPALCINHHQIKAILSHSDLDKHTHALIFSRLDDCSSLLSLSHLQLVQDAASRLLPGCKVQCHITPIPTTGSLYI